MNAELKAKWLTALRSGEYLQGEGRLFSPQDTSYCCLGVLCDVSGVGHWRDGHYAVDNDASGWLLPVNMALDIFGTSEDVPNDYGDPVDYANQDGTLPFKDYEGVTMSLTNLNDSGQFSFDQIADVIEWAF